MEFKLKGFGGSYTNQISYEAKILWSDEGCRRGRDGDKVD